MSRTPAAQLARLKVTYQEFHIWRGERDTGFFAVPREPGPPHMSASTVAELEVALMAWAMDRAR